MSGTPPTLAASIPNARVLPKLSMDDAVTLARCAGLVVGVDTGLTHIAAAFLPRTVELQHRLFDPAVPDPADLIVIPLAFIGDRERVYRDPPAKAAVIHDWMWRPRGGGARVSWLLLKRLNLVTR